MADRATVDWLSWTAQAEVVGNSTGFASIIKRLLQFYRRWRYFPNLSVESSTEKLLKLQSVSEFVYKTTFPPPPQFFYIFLNE